MVRKIKAKLVLRLRSEGLTGRQIAAQGMSRTSVAMVLDAADREGIGWDDVAALDEADVYARLFPGRGEHDSVHAQPDWEKVHKELAKVGVTLKLLHGEYVDACHSRGETAMGYDRFCKSYQRHVLVIGAASRVGHKAGQTVEVDWSGKTMRLTDPVAGQAMRVYLFVATLPFSRYAFVEPALDMRQDTWLRANAAMFDWFGGSVPRIVPDNLKTGVIKHPAEGESRKHFLVALEELRIPAVRWHDLRHSYASACASAGIPIERVAKYMGHADIGTMYKHYLHLFSDDHTDDMARLAAVAARTLTPVAQIGI